MIGSGVIEENGRIDRMNRSPSSKSSGDGSVRVKFLECSECARVLTLIGDMREICVVYNNKIQHKS